MKNQGTGLGKRILSYTSEALLHIKLLVIIYQLRYKKGLLKKAYFKVQQNGHIFIPEYLNWIKSSSLPLPFYPTFPCPPLKAIIVSTYNSNRIIAPGGCQAEILHMCVGF